MSIGQSAMVICSWGVKAAIVHSTCGLNLWVAGKTVWSVINACHTWVR